MIKTSTVKKFIGILGFLIVLIPFSGFPGVWKDVLTVLFGSMILLSVIYKPILIEVFRILHELKNEKNNKQENKQENDNDEQ